MIKALIIDDEPAAANVLRLMIERYIPEITDLRIAIKLEEAYALIIQFDPDLVFLDIVMPNKNGFEFLTGIKEIHFEIIFTTAYNEYAIYAIRFSALDYLLKPINAGELKNAVERFLEKRDKQLQSQALLKNFLENLQHEKEAGFKLAVPTVNGALFFPPSEIVRLEGESNYTRFYLVNNKQYLSSKTLKDYEDILLPYHFLRVHKSHLVNKRFVQNYKKEGMVVLHDKSTVPVSRQRKQEIEKSLTGK